MCYRNTFLHTCGHIGAGPPLHINAVYTDRYNLALSPCVGMEALELPISFNCPFCSDRGLREHVEDGLGVLAFLVASHNSPFASGWQITHVRSADEIDYRDWQDAYAQGGLFNQMAWIPKPCGHVQVPRRSGHRTTGHRSRSGTEVDCTWRQSLGEPVRSRLPGMISELSAALRRGRQRDED